jgi:prepilin-type N-terminal cleavage/methylation domain-containing protein
MNLRHRQGGFTLVELITSIVLIGAMAAVGATMISDNMTIAINANSASTSADQARYAMQRVARELREVSYSTAVSGGAYAISSSLASGATSITFTRSIAGTPTTVTLFRDGSTLKLQYGTNAASVLVPNVTAFSLTFLDGSNVSTGLTTTTVRAVQVSLTVADSGSGLAIAQRTRIALRNS